MTSENKDDICCCPVCGRMISYLEYHRDDLKPGYWGYCYTCEDNERMEKGDR